MRLLLLVMLGFAITLGLAACGTAEPLDLSDTSPAGMTAATRGGTALDLLRGRYPNLQIEETSRGISIRIRQRAHPPVVIVDGFRSPAAHDGQLDTIMAADIVEIRVLRTMADTLIYGEEAALGGVIEIETRLAPER